MSDDGETITVKVTPALRKHLDGIRKTMEPTPYSDAGLLNLSAETIGGVVWDTIDDDIGKRTRALEMLIGLGLIGPYDRPALN